MHLHIPTPCGEDWNEMTPSAAGRHCAQCAKTVIDFREMTAVEIGLYLQLNAGNKICGRFTEDQLAHDIPSPEAYVLHVLRAPLPFLKQIAAVIIFALFIGAAPIVAQAKQKAKITRQAITGAPQELPQNTQPHPSGQVAPKKPVDTAEYNQPEVMGIIARPPEKDRIPKHPPKQKPRK